MKNESTVRFLAAFNLSELFPDDRDRDLLFQIADVTELDVEVFKRGQGVYDCVSDVSLTGLFCVEGCPPKKYLKPCVERPEEKPEFNNDACVRDYFCREQVQAPARFSLQVSQSSAFKSVAKS